LTQNACEAAPEGATLRWRIFADETAGTVTLDLHNTGPAILPELLARVMEPFVSTKQSGTGLGLAIVKRLVEIQGGDIEIRSTEGEGTCVTLRFPHAASIKSRTLENHSASAAHPKIPFNDQPNHACMKFDGNGR
jgi:signal transduction histidine kinase